MAKRVLVVEDNELNLKLFCDLLRAHDFSAEPVRDGREAVVRAREFRPDLIVMDIQLPHVSGYDLILQLKADPVLRSIPVMAVSAAMPITVRIGSVKKPPALCHSRMSGLSRYSAVAAIMASATAMITICA